MKKKILSLTLSFAIILATLIFTTVLNTSAAGLSLFTQISQTARTTGYNMKGMVRNGDYLYVSTSADGIQIFEIQSDNTLVDVTPAGNTDIQAVDAPDDAQDDMIIYNNKLYAIDWARFDRPGEPHGIKAFDLTDPASPTFERLFTSDTFMRGIEIYNNHLYISTNGSYLHIYDLGNPTSTMQSLSMYTAGTEQRITTTKFYKGYMYSYIGSQDGSGRVDKYIYTAKLTSPTTHGGVTAYKLAKQTTSSTQTAAMEIIGNMLYVGVPTDDSADGTMCAIDITIPNAFLTNSNLVYYYKRPSGGNSATSDGAAIERVTMLSGAGNYLLRGGMDGAIALYDISDPFHFDPIKTKKIGGVVRDIFIDESEKIVFANTEDNIFLYSYSDVTGETVKYEAEFGDLTNCAGDGSFNTYSDLSDVNMSNILGVGNTYTSVGQWVYVPVSGTRRLFISGAFPNIGNNGENFITMQLKVNSVVQTPMEIRGTGWNRSRTEGKIELEAGFNYIEFTPVVTGVAQEANPYSGTNTLFDYFEISKELIISEIDKVYQIYGFTSQTTAADVMGLPGTTQKDGVAVLSGETTSQGSATGWFDDDICQTATFTVNAFNSGTRSLEFAFRGSGEPWSVKFNLIVNGASAPITFTTSKVSWAWSSGFGENGDGINGNFKTDVYLNAGVNTIVLEYANEVGFTKHDVQLGGMYLTFNEPQTIPFAIGNPVLIGGNGVKTAIVPAGQSAASYIEIATQEVGTPKTCLFVTAYYGAGNRLLEVQTDSGVYGGAIGVTKLQTYSNVPAGAIKCSMFLWDGTGSMVPVKTFAPIE